MRKDKVYEREKLRPIEKTIYISIYIYIFFFFFERNDYLGNGYSK